MIGILIHICCLGTVGRDLGSGSFSHCNLEHVMSLEYGIMHQSHDRLCQFWELSSSAKKHSHGHRSLHYISKMHVI